VLTKVLTRIKDVKKSVDKIVGSGGGFIAGRG